ncbi:DEAD/DEAH box helicase, partial [Winogradskyella sp.]|nr:DEAD/DEAH box helicase [Winogradskyella sp.]
VIHYQLPDEPEIYTHRSGRTGRAGKTGISMVIASKSEVRKIKGIERIIKKEFEKKEVPSSESIVEIQLMALANKIHATETNDEIDKHLGGINELFADTEKEDLIKKFFSVEFNRFYNYYQKSKGVGRVESRDSDRDSGRDYGKQSNDSRYFINVGSKDGFDWMKLKDFLKEQLELGRDDVFKVDIKESFSFFNTEKELQEKVIAFFTDFKYEGRFVNVEVSENKGRSGGGRRDRGGRGGNDRRSGGGGRRRDDKPRGERRSSDRGDRSSSSDSRGDRRSSGGSSNRSDRRRSDDSRGDRRPSETSSTSERPRRSRRRD